MLNEINIITWIYLFLIYLIIDVINMLYIIAAQKRHALGAANYSFAISFLGCLGISSYLENPLNIIPVCLGAWFGTYITLWWEKRK